jgi:hypothetical protein
VNFAGIFVDPRYQPASDCRDKFDVERCKFDPKADPAFPRQSDPNTEVHYDSARTSDGRNDDALALACAKAVSAIDKTLVRGNHVDDGVEAIVHYAAEGDPPDAYSLGDWGPVEVKTSAGAPGARPGAPVYTIETKDNHQSWAFFDGVQVMTEDGEVIPADKITPPRATPEMRAAKKKPAPIGRPAKFDPSRSKQLQAYAQGIIDTILDKP